MSNVESARKFAEALLVGLPEDDLQAARTIQERISERIKRETGGGSIGAAADSPTIRAGLVVFAAFLDRSFGTELTPQAQTLNNNQTVWNQVRSSLRSLEHAAEKLALDDVLKDLSGLTAQVVDERDGQAFGTAVLNESDRERIFASIEKIRLLVEQSTLSERKKDAIYRQLSALHEEVARPSTRTERIFGFFGDLALLAGEMAEKAEPAIEQAKDIIRIVVGKRAKQEGIELPEPERWPQLPSPKDEE